MTSSALLTVALVASRGAAPGAEESPPKLMVSAYGGGALIIENGKVIEKIKTKGGCQDAWTLPDGPRLIVGAGLLTKYDAEVRLTGDAVVGLQTRVQRGGFEKRKVEFQVGQQKFSYDLPRDLYFKRPFKDWKSARHALDNPDQPILCGKIYVTPLEDHLPTEDELWIAGRFVGKEGRYADITVGDRPFKMATQGHDGQERIMGLLTHEDIKPFVQQAFVHGVMKGDVFCASEVGIRMLEDSKAKDDPKLGRYLFIGDSISGNYDRALRAALTGKLNLYHPPTNCGATGKGKENMGQWLGAYDTPGHEWDVISFNFGHWDSGNTKARYQTALEDIVAMLGKTGAKLIFVTTCPVPGGYERAPDVDDKGGDTKAPGRQHGVMRKYVNPWALEVIARHPEIAVCDQHALVVGEKFYAAWYAKAGTKTGRGSEYGDVHLGGLLGEPIGRQLARKVLDVLGREDEALGPASVPERDLLPERQRPSTRGMDVKDYLDLLSSDARLRTRNR